MEKPETALKTLEVLGLSNSQAKIYLTLIRLGSATVGRVANSSGVRREDVYRALPSLEKLGLIEKNLGAPSKISVVPLETALAALVKRQQDEANEKISDLLRKKDQLLENWKTVTREPAAEESAQFSLLQGRNATAVKAETLIKNSREGIDYLVLKRQMGHFLSSYEDLLKRALKRGVVIRIITELPGESGELPVFMSGLLSSGGISLRCVESVPIHVGIYDKKEVLADTSAEASFEHGPALYSRNRPMVQALEKVFDDLWDASKDWNSARLNHENGNRKIPGQLGQHLGQRLQTTRGGNHRHNVKLIQTSPSPRNKRAKKHII